MKVVYINAVPYGSTGRIMFSLADIVQKDGGKTICTTGFSWRKCSRDDYIITSNIFEKYLHTIFSKYTGMIGFLSLIPTWRLLKKIDKFQPDILHLHNLHGWYINLPMLFSYIKNKNIKVVWTLHDCWSFTGCCAHFDMIVCNKWQTGCFDCPQYRSYPQSYIDNSDFMYKYKRKWFVGVKNMTIVTPSSWLAELVKKSFLKDYPVKVINNGIDLDVYKLKDSDFRINYNLKDKKIILGVAFGWDERKGLDVFVDLSKRLGDEYKIVLVGTDKKTDEILPRSIISIHTTESQEELAKIYSAADLFVNPTREENYPTVNMEALACGTPVLTFNTGGSQEIIDSSCGSVVEKNDIDSLEREIIRICEERPYSEEACIKKAESFDMGERFKEYMDLYRGIL